MNYFKKKNLQEHHELQQGQMNQQHRKDPK